MRDHLSCSTTPAPTVSQASEPRKRGSLQFVAPAKSSATSTTKWRAACVPTHGGLKLADSPPCCKMPGHKVFRGVWPMATEAWRSGLSRAFNARHYARHLVSRRRNGARSGRWS